MIVGAKGLRFAIFSWAVVLLVASAISTQAQTGSRITSPVSPSTRATILHSTHPLAKAEFDRGAIDPGQQLQRLILVLGTSPEQDAQLRTLLDSQQTAGSTDYHRWLTPEDFGRRFGPDSQDVQQVKAWLEQQGFAVTTTARSGRWIEFSGTAAQVSTAFQTSLHQYEVAGATHIANASEISLPAALSPVVRGVLSLHDFFSKPLLTRYYQVHRDVNGTLVPVNPAFTYNPGNLHYLAPADFTTIYNTNPLYQAGTNGLGTSIAIVGRSKVEVTDSQIFRNIFGLPDNDPQMIVNGADPGFTGSGDSVEASLDVQWAGAVAPAATIKLVVSNSSATTDGVALSAAYIVDHNLADVLSVSFGTCEKRLTAVENAFWSSLWQQAAAQGISVFVASGDTGAAGCDYIDSGTPASGGQQVNALASTPFNTAVGGTQFQENGNYSTFWKGVSGTAFGSAIGYIPEAVWNESCDPTVLNSLCSFNGYYSLAASAGGVSTLYTKPSWQSAPGVPNDSHRDLPDVSLAAGSDSDGYLFCVMGSCQTTTDSQGAPLLLQASVVGGTSASAPSFAGLAALIAQKAGGRQGLPNYLLYKLAAAETFAQCDSNAQTNPATRSNCAFNDITSGNNSVPGQVGYSASPAFDLATGLGSVNAVNLVNAWISAAATFQGSKTSLVATVNGTSVNSISLAHGSAVTLTANVQAISGSAVPSGNASFLTDRYDAIGGGGLLAGSLTTTLSSLPGGSYNLTAHYPGDATFGASDSAAIPVTITPENSVVNLTTSSGNANSISVPYGSYFYVTASVSSASGKGAATGSLTLLDGNTKLTTVALDNTGVAELPLCGSDFCLALGTHTITATYSGDNSLNPGATTQPLSITITKGGAFSYFSIFPADSTGQRWSLQVALSPGGYNSILPTGTVQFTDNAAALGSVQTLVSPAPGYAPTATVNVSLSPGVHNLAFSYSGDNTYSAYNAPSYAVSILPPFGLSSSNSLATIKIGQSASYNVSLTSNYGYSGNISLTCSGAPSWATCNIAPSTIQLLPYGATPFVVTVTTTQTASQHSFPLHTLPLVFAGFVASLCATRRRSIKAAALVLTLCAILCLASCGGGGTTTTPSTPPTTSIPTLPQSIAIVITGSDGKSSANVVLGLQVNQ